MIGAVSYLRSNKSSATKLKENLFANNPITQSYRRVLLQICHSSLEIENPKDRAQDEGFSVENTKVGSDANGGGFSNCGTSILPFALWGCSYLL